jgi:hypothetical protein
MGYLFTHGANDGFWSPHLKQGHRTSYLFLGDRNPAANRRTSHSNDRHDIEQAHKLVVEDFTLLQSIWRRQSALRRAPKVVASTRQEQEVWSHLIEYLTKLPPPSERKRSGRSA